MRLFKSEKQVEQVKEIPLLTANKDIHHNLHLASLDITYSVSSRQMYSAHIKYEERPTEWNNHGAELTEEIKADSWPSLIEKVLKHFEVQQVPHQTNKGEA